MKFWSLGPGRSPGEGNDNPLQCCCLENPMDRGARGQRVRHSWTDSAHTHAKKRLGKRTCCLSQNQFRPFTLSQDIETSSWGRKGLLKVLKLAHTFMQGSANFTYKGGDVNNLILGSHKVLVMTTYLCCGIQKWAEMIHQGKSIPIKFYLQKQAADRIQFLSCYFPLSALQCQMLIRNEQVINLQKCNSTCT